MSTPDSEVSRPTSGEGGARRDLRGGGFGLGFWISWSGGGFLRSRAICLVASALVSSSEFE
jgi:hypothetical protein